MLSRETWDLLIKGGSAGAAIATVAVSAIVFFSQRERWAQDFEREVKRPFLDKQLELYGEAVAVASRLAHAADQGQQLSGPNVEDDLAEDLERFWVLYWGPLAMVEDSRVEGAMVMFGRSLQDNQNDVDNGCAQMIEQASLVLAHRARASLEEQWGVELVIEAADFDRREGDWGELQGACEADRRQK